MSSATRVTPKCGRISCGIATASDNGPQSPERRAWLTGALASGVTVWSPLPTLADDPRMARPQEGDTFVFATGDRALTPISEADVALGGPPGPGAGQGAPGR